GRSSRKLRDGATGVIGTGKLDEPAVLAPWGRLLSVFDALGAETAFWMRSIRDIVWRNLQ
ncbi:MAG TPA: hypothetical protein VF474_00650, partial [Phenylobacterium sp.]